VYLEQNIGLDQFEAMLKAYIKKFRQKSIVSDDWINFLKDYFPDKKEFLDNVDFDGWLYKPVSYI
jgi:leukotriene-A4 hydrolase